MNEPEYRVILTLTLPLPTNAWHCCEADTDLSPLVSRVAQALVFQSMPLMAKASASTL